MTRADMRRIAACSLLAACACAREPLAWECPEVAPGELVVSEIRGEQSGAAQDGAQWIEVYNAAGNELDLAGLRLLVRTLDGSSEAVIVVRRRWVSIPAGGYAVLGRAEAGQEPAHVDYGYLADFEGDLYGRAAIELWACGELVDRVIYQDLPQTGSLALSGATAPDAQANDDESAWCAAEAAGTPGAENPPCS